MEPEGSTANTMNGEPEIQADEAGSSPEAAADADEMEVADQTLPDTVTELESPTGAKVYVVGTAHVSRQSATDVERTIEIVAPDVVMLELCRARVSILTLDEAAMLERAQTMGVVESIMDNRKRVSDPLYLLLSELYAFVTRQVGVVPGVELRAGFRAGRAIGAKIVLCDRAINVTMKRAWAALSLWDKVRLVFDMIWDLPSLTEKDIEDLKNKDIFEQLLDEFSTKFPTFAEVLLKERDLYLTHQLRNHQGSKIVAVIGMGHVAGIRENWDKPINVAAISRIPPAKRTWSWTGRIAASGALVALGFAIGRIAMVRR